MNAYPQNIRFHHVAGDILIHGEREDHRKIVARKLPENEVLWRLDLPTEPAQSNYCLHRGDIVVFMPFGRDNRLSLFTVDIRTGEILAQRTMPEHTGWNTSEYKYFDPFVVYAPRAWLRQVPVILLPFSRESTKVCALDPTTLETLWSCETEAAPRVGRHNYCQQEDRVHLGTLDKENGRIHLQCRSLREGDLLWKRTLALDPKTSPNWMVMRPAGRYIDVWSAVHKLTKRYAEDINTPIDSLTGEDYPKEKQVYKYGWAVRWHPDEEFSALKTRAILRKQDENRGSHCGRLWAGGPALCVESHSYVANVAPRNGMPYLGTRVYANSRMGLRGSRGLAGIDLFDSACRGYSKVLGGNLFFERTRFLHAIGWTAEKDRFYRLRDALTIDPPGAAVVEPVTVTLKPRVDGTALHYTLDGSEPTPASTRYEKPITIAKPATLKVYVDAPDFVQGVVAAHFPDPVKAIDPGAVVPGLWREYFFDRFATDLSEFPHACRLTYKACSHVAQVSRGSKKSGKIRQAERYSGYLRVVRTGEYGFTLTSNHGCRLVLNKRTVFETDGTQPKEPHAATVKLEAGLHRFEFHAFYGAGNAIRKLEWEGPDIEKGPVPETAFRRKHESEEELFCTPGFVP